MNKRLASALLCAALLGSGILRADNIVISNRKSSILITAPKGESPRIQYFGPRLANPGDVFDSGSAFNDPVYPQFGVQCSRETAIQATHNDGNMSLELVVESVTRENRDGGQVTAIATRDKFYPFYVTIYYKTYPDCEVIETWTEIRHLEKKPVTLYRFASAFLPVRRGDNWLSHFHGPWGAEAYLYEEALTDGMRVIKDKDGVRNTQNSCPSFMLTLDGRPDEQHGMVIGGTLAWSGNYRIAIDNDNAHTTRIFAGINEDQSQYILEPKEVFTTPVFAFTFSDEGKGGVSRNFHRWARLHRLNHGGEQRSILLNSWEGVSMNVNQEVMDQMMADFAAMGGEMFVMDDGWFGDKYPRNNGTSSLGDWVVCKEKLPEGIKGLTASAREKGLTTVVELGEAAFYGPKLDFMVKDAIGRKWQLGTIQVDYNLPERFDLTYKGADDKLHRPIMIHRAPFGSMERFVAVLLEHTGGKFPLWLSPQQVVVLPISEKFNDYAQKVAEYLNRNDVRTEVDDRNEKIGRKIRDNELKRVPYLLIVGEKEEAEGLVSVRAQGEGDKGQMTMEAFRDLIAGLVKEEIDANKLEKK